MRHTQGLFTRTLTSSGNETFSPLESWRPHVTTWSNSGCPGLPPTPPPSGVHVPCQLAPSIRIIPLSASTIVSSRPFTKFAEPKSHASHPQSGTRSISMSGSAMLTQAIGASPVSVRSLSRRSRGSVSALREVKRTPLLKCEPSNSTSRGSASISGSDASTCTQARARSTAMKNFSGLVTRASIPRQSPLDPDGGPATTSDWSARTPRSHARSASKDSPGNHSGTSILDH